MILRETQRAVTPFGRVAVFIVYLQRIGLVEQVRRHLPIQWHSPNYIEPAATWMAFLMTVLVGAKRFAHAALLRGDQALDALLGMKRFPTDGTIGNLFRQFGMGEIQRFFEPMTKWQMQRLPLRPEGYTLWVKRAAQQVETWSVLDEHYVPASSASSYTVGVWKGASW